MFGQLVLTFLSTSVWSQRNWSLLCCPLVSFCPKHSFCELINENKSKENSYLIREVNVWLNAKNAQKYIKSIAMISRVIQNTDNNPIKPQRVGASFQLKCHQLIGQQINSITKYFIWLSKQKMFKRSENWIKLEKI